MPTEKIENSHQEAMPAHLENSTDATRGEPLAVRALKRKQELEAALKDLPATEARARGDIELAITSIQSCLTGDQEHLTSTTAATLNRVLEGTKHLAEIHDDQSESR
jgi:hypothetical protein